MTASSGFWSKSEWLKTHQNSDAIVCGWKRFSAHALRATIRQQAVNRGLGEVNPALEMLPVWLMPHDASVREILAGHHVIEVRTRNSDLIARDVCAVFSGVGVKVNP